MLLVVPAGATWGCFLSSFVEMGEGSTVAVTTWLQEKDLQGVCGVPASLGAQHGHMSVPLVAEAGGCVGG